MGTQPQPPAEPWVKLGATYDVISAALGSFIGHCVEVHGEWAAFTILDGNDRLMDAGLNPGDRVELSRRLTHLRGR